MRALVGYALAMIALAGCEAREETLGSAENANADLCHQLIYILQQGTIERENGGAFASLKGGRVDDGVYRGSTLMKNSSACFVVGSEFSYRTLYRCNYGDTGTATIGDLRHEVNQLSTSIEECLIRENPFQPSRTGETVPRYWTRGFSDIDRVEFFDSWWHQNVRLDIDADGPGSRLTLEIRSKYY